ncbi:hypothetical protein [Glycomyces sp. NRRL B-16210]|uniref:hypothetical protein n=1 Tax=Glycomyces sp. NRRL B-16210 TaxID=1463821 RepID=UPI0006897512|nr:hypothetical protein [Glycomyces sp. NRRL B-16210]
MKRNLHLTSLIAGPLLGAIATFYWTGDRYGVTASVLLMFSTVAWIYGLLGVWERVAEHKPWLGGTGIVLALAGFTGGMAFSLQGFFEAIFDISGTASLDAAAEHPVAAALVLWLPGPAFPLCLAALGVSLTWTRLAPWWLGGLLVLSAVAFPLSRITRTEAIAHVADLLILASFVALALVYLRTDLRRAAPETA